MTVRMSWITTILLVIGLASSPWFAEYVRAIYMSGGFIGAFPTLESQTYARVVVTSNVNIADPGTSTFDGVDFSSGGTRMLLVGQSDATQNGLRDYGGGIHSALTRTTDADTSAEWALHFSVYIEEGQVASNGGTNAGSIWTAANTGAVILGSTNISFVKSSLGLGGELKANRDVASGIPTLGSDAKLNPAQIESFAQHIDLSNASTITVTKRQMGVQCASGACDFTPGHDQIADGTTDNQVAEILGTDPVKTVKFHNGDNVQLCGNTGSVVVGSTKASMFVKWNSGASVWQQLGCTPAHQGFDVDPVVGLAACGTATNPRWGSATDYSEDCLDTGNIPTRVSYCGGSRCASTKIANLQLDTDGAKPTCGSTFRHMIWPTNSASSVADFQEVCDKDSADVYAWRKVVKGPIVRTYPMTFQTYVESGTFNLADASRFSGGSGGVYRGVRFVDGDSTCAVYTHFIAADLAATPAWRLIVTSKAAAPSTGGNIVARPFAKVYGHNEVIDAAETILESAHVVTVSTNLNSTQTTFPAAGDFDAIVALAASKSVRVVLCRQGADASDNLTATWDVLDVEIQYAINR